MVVEKFDVGPALQEGMLPVGGKHSIYYHCYGNPEGIPVVRLHGGPGSNSKSRHTGFFDPEKFFIVLYDQRGCGKSKPSGSIINNTTQDLVEDLEKLREHLDVDRWMVVGGTWGATLALVYAQTYPTKVTGLALYGTFLAENWNLDWVYGKNGAARFFPEHYAEFVQDLSFKEQQDVFSAYGRRLLEVDKKSVQKSAALTMMKYFGALSSMEFHQMADQERFDDLSKKEQKEEQKDYEHFAWTHARLQRFYEENDFFLEEGQVIRNMSKIQHIPMCLVHGRYDLICPVLNADVLHRAHTKSDLVIVADAGHSSEEIVGVLLDVINEKMVEVLI